MNSPSRLHRFLRDPIFHFVVIGLLIFTYDRFTGEDQEESTEQVVRVTSDDVDRFASVFEERYGRAPDDEERRALVEDFVREEILYREALAMGLDRDDTIVRRRLAQKLAFVSGDEGPVEEPDEAALRAWFGANRGLYRVEPRYSFVHTFFSREARGDAAEADALRALAEMRDDAGSGGVPTGDESPIAAQMNEAAASELDSPAGIGFAEQLASLPTGEWSGPLETEQGYYIVLIRQKLDGYEPAYGDVRDAVLSDWLAEQSRRVDPAFYDELKARYRVELDDDVAS